MSTTLTVKRKYIIDALGLSELDIIQSPKLEHYRNNQMYSFGTDQHGVAEVGLFLDPKSRELTPCSSDPNGSLLAKDVARFCLNWIVGHSDLDIFWKDSTDRHNYVGFWRHVTIKENHLGDFMVIFRVLIDSSATQTTWDSEMTHLITAMLAKYNSSTCGRLVSAYYQSSDNLTESKPVDPFHKIYKADELIMHLDGHQFIRSVSSFFQPNAYTASIIYNVVKDMATNDSDSETDAHLLDVCCGTGTIGIYLAQWFKMVYGLDRTPEAVKDAESNAKLNKISHKTKYYTGNAEDLMNKIIEDNRLIDQPLVAVVNPPRRGLYPAVLEALNDCTHLQKLIYVSCNVDTLKRDMSMLRFKHLKQIVAVDQFPNTDHCEVIVELSA